VYICTDLDEYSISHFAPILGQLETAMGQPETALGQLEKALGQHETPFYPPPDGLGAVG